MTGVLNSINRMLAEYDIKLMPKYVISELNLGDAMTPKDDEHKQLRDEVLEHLGTRKAGRHVERIPGLRELYRELCTTKPTEDKIQKARRRRKTGRNKWKQTEMEEQEQRQKTIEWQKRAIDKWNEVMQEKDSWETGRTRKEPKANYRDPTLSMEKRMRKAVNRREKKKRGKETRKREEEDKRRHEEEEKNMSDGEGTGYQAHRSPPYAKKRRGDQDEL